MNKNLIIIFLSIIVILCFLYFFLKRQDKKKTPKGRMMEFPNIIGSEKKWAFLIIDCDYIFNIGFVKPDNEGHFDVIAEGEYMNILGLNYFRDINEAIQITNIISEKNEIFGNINEFNLYIYNIETKSTHLLKVSRPVIINKNNISVIGKVSMKPLLSNIVIKQASIDSNIPSSIYVQK